MDCACGEKAVVSNPPRCKEHFLEHFEQRVWDTIERFELIRPAERVLVAASGGKDSLALLSVLSQRHTVQALAVDEGIPGYRDKTLSDLQLFCSERAIPLRVVSFEDMGAQPLHVQAPKRPCTACGVLRRKALLEGSAGYDVLATGHNLDDEAQTILMNLLRNNVALNARIGPRTAGNVGPPRVKPFYLTPEREVRAYCLLKGIKADFAECPNASGAFRIRVGEALNRLEREVLGAKRNIVERFLREHFEDSSELRACTVCKGPCSALVCKACALKAQ
jgi:tRNA-5-methyluridine54 2-sulfurtransferase